MTTTVEIHAPAYNHHNVVVKNNHNTTLAVLSPGAHLKRAYVFDGTHLVIFEGDVVVTEPTSGLARFQSIKQVFAGEITEIVDAGAYVCEANGTSVLRIYPPNFTVRYQPKVGDFWVVYDGDGYQSVSPREAFLAGYVPLLVGDEVRGE